MRIRAIKGIYATRILLLLMLVLLTLPAAVHAEFTFETNNGALTITGYTGPGGDVIIPDATNDLPVTSIGDWAFFDCTSLSSIVIGNSVTNVGERAFFGCTNLINATIGNSVTRIGDWAFAYCNNLINIAIPYSVTNIGDRVFAGSTRLSAITVHALNSYYSSVDGVLFNKSTTTLIRYPEGKSGSDYTIPNSVISIGSHAFYYCRGSTNVTIPDSVTSIGEAAFYSCTSLLSITIPNSVNSIGRVAFPFCTNLTTATIGSGVSSIGSTPFYYCSNLKEITVDTNNPAYSSVDGVLFNKSRTVLIQYPAGKAGSYVIPNGVTNIGNSVFYCCTKLTGVTIPDEVVGIEPRAFAFCYGLTNVTIGNNATSIGDSAFIWCESLTSVTIGHGLTNIGRSAFACCSSLTGVYFQGRAPTVDSDGFYNCTNAFVYYLPGTTGWGSTFRGRPTALWKSQILTCDDRFGVQTNQFGFNISWASSMDVAVDACTNLSNPFWTPLQTNTLTSDTLYFSDPDWTNHPTRFYRLRWP